MALLGQEEVGHLDGEVDVGPQSVQDRGEASHQRHLNALDVDFDDAGPVEIFGLRTCGRDTASICNEDSTMRGSTAAAPRLVECSR